MSKVITRMYSIPNGNITYHFPVYECNGCKREIPEGFPRYEDDSDIFCMECAYRRKLISGTEYLRDQLHLPPELFDVTIHDGEVHLKDKRSKWEWERTNRQRNNKAYEDWRTSVFTRDNFTCAICGQVGGELEAHHIKPYAKYPSHRLDVDNGITLCKRCHKRVHKEKNSEWIHLP